MALLKLPCEVQSMLCASSRINSYTRAVEELVYNSLDADSTSIAIRVNIEDNAIQVLDNGQGILKRDFKRVGQKYMTSKCVDLATLKAKPNKYGYRGESLANVIKVSQTVNITSRHEQCENTWTKAFVNGREGRTTAINTRPSKGTTVDIKGFLYNLHIQKKAVNALNEMQAIKSFLEHLSLVHNNISISLRDDSTNEIVFKLHKQRDVYQTLSTLFGIKGPDIQELRVEKGLYKVTGFIGKTDSKIAKHWIYLNGKFVNNCKLHKVLNENLSNSVGEENLKKSKLKCARDDSEYTLLKNKIPFYFVFITCPYMDYDMNYMSKQNTVEFKNWDQIKKFLEKLIKFYTGDINLRVIQKPKTVREETDTRSEVKKIIERVLKSNCKKISVSHMQKGVKGRMIKRKHKKKSTNLPEISLSKIIPPKAIIGSNNAEEITVSPNPRIQHNNNSKECGFRNIKKTKNKTVILSNNTRKPKCIKTSVLNETVDKTDIFAEVLQENGKVQDQITRPEILRQKDKIQERRHKSVNKTNMKKFENPTSSLKRRYEIISKEAEDILYKEQQKLRKICRDNNTLDQNAKKDQNNYVSKKINADTPSPPKFNKLNIEKHSRGSTKDKQFKTTYDLIQTILQSQRNLASEIKNNQNSGTFYKEPHHFKKPHKNILQSRFQCVSKFTFESHNYNKDSIETDISHVYHLSEKARNPHFITKQSADNCNVRKGYSKAFDYDHRQVYNKRQYKHNSKIGNNYAETSYTIEYTQNNQVFTSKDSFLNLTGHVSGTYSNFSKDKLSRDINDFDKWYRNTKLNSRNTYTISTTQKSVAVFTDFPSSNRDENYLDLHKTYCIEKSQREYYSVNENTHTQMRNDNRNIVFVSSQTPNEQAINLDPLVICETVLTDDVDDGDQNYDDLNIFLSQELNTNGFTKANDAQDLNDNANEIHRFEEVSHHFVPSNTCNVKELVIDNEENNATEADRAVPDQQDNKLKHSPLILISPILNDKESSVEENIEVDKVNKHAQLNGKNKEMVNISYDVNNFNLKYRPRFLPKGMSQIFANCNSKTACNYDFDKDYFEGNMYDDFAKHVQINSELFKPRIENVNRYTTKDIEKVSHKLNKDNASLIFKGEYLKEAKVLGQVDEKFIAAVMKGKCNQNKAISDFLILFDQHAVHERIRLEKSLLDYFDGNQWKSVQVDEITLKVSSNDVLYLHNYKNKFAQLGLQWIVLDNREVSITAIPEAILGKNPRQEDKIMVAVKNLIAEEINMIKILKGCVSLYPKSIMDLVFSEACRYAIKFGDKLSLNDCMELLKDLSECKTPFQCAHGRPVMAVLMGHRHEDRKYEINFKSLNNFKKRLEHHLK